MRFKIEKKIIPFYDVFVNIIVVLIRIVSTILLLYKLLYWIYEKLKKNPHGKLLLPVANVNYKSIIYKNIFL